MSKVFGILRSSRRFTLLMGIVALLALGFLVSRPPCAWAAVLKKQTCTYYTDASLTTVSGWAHFRCNGSIDQQFGTLTAYSVCDYDYCCGSVWC